MSPFDLVKNMKKIKKDATYIRRSLRGRAEHDQSFTDRSISLSRSMSAVPKESKTIKSQAATPKVPEQKTMNRNLSLKTLPKREFESGESSTSRGHHKMLSETQSIHYAIKDYGTPGKFAKSELLAADMVARINNPN